MEAPPIRTVLVTILRDGVEPLACRGIGRAILGVYPQVGVDTEHLGVAFRLVSGSLPFRLPDFPVEIFPSSLVGGSWTEPASPARRAFHARVQAAYVSQDGTRGPWYEFEISHPGRWPWLAWLGSAFWYVVGGMVLVTGLFVGAAVRTLLVRRALRRDAQDRASRTQGPYA